MSNRGRFWRGRGYNRFGTRGRGWGSSRGTGRGASAESSNLCHPKRTSNQHCHTAPVPVPTDCPFKAWDLYFASTVYTPLSNEKILVCAFEEYFRREVDEWHLDEIERKRAIQVDFATLICNEGLLNDVPNFSTITRNSPDLILNSMGLAVYQVIASRLSGLEYTSSFPKVNVRLVNYEPITSLKHLKASQYGKLVTIRGTAVRVGNVKPLVTQMAFQCNACSSMQVQSLQDGKYTTPTKCENSCRTRSFTPLRSSQETQTIDWQIVRVQEIMSDDNREAGRIPRSVECELTADLVDSCVPGDLVTVTAIVKATGSDEGRGRGNKDKCMFLIYLSAVSVTTSRGQGTGQGPHMEFSSKDYSAIQEIQGDSNVLRLLVGSLCPAIYGHELVKAGLVLGLFGGCPKFLHNQNCIPVRGDLHILVVGDPGLGKSQMLQSAANIAPRGVYVCGNTTTTSGLTVTLSKDGASGDYALEAGALVLADMGCCCIDEFDKMGSQHQALLEAMEQQSISIAKAGIVCSLPARTSILAAANPAGGHYNKAKTVAENLRMGSALLSRFDLVFILLDKPDEEMDTMLSEHVMALHSGKKNSVGGLVKSKAASVLELRGDDDAYREWEKQKPLSERLKFLGSEFADLLPHCLFRKYVGYARRYVHPKLSPEAAGILQSFYLELRQRYHSSDSTPITTRQLESLIRLTEARARIELREVATKEDAEDIVEIMKYSMIDTYSDDFGVLDFNRSQHGSGMSSRNQAKRFVAALNRVTERTTNSLFSVQQMRQIAKDMRLQITNFDDFIASLNCQNFLLQKGPRVYQIQTSNCF
ncbi:DNA helicase MCM8-like [Corticium candelabrum]|uniref:DNA helicase MCM8-like n=1 Tax=Corticium candelabrum TaxID=121492 RepID=UPI002E26EE76|nr:DNA helicase MCM8-like [Corticium candelabrum]